LVVGRRVTASSFTVVVRRRRSPSFAVARSPSPIFLFFARSPSFFQRRFTVAVG